MKKSILIITLVISSLFVKAQSQEMGFMPKAYLGFGSGINAYTGLLGAAANLRFAPKAFIEGGVGIGGWGYKYSIGVRYDFKYRNTFGLGVNLSGATGLQGMEMDMELFNGRTESVTLNCNHSTTVDLKGRYSIASGRKNIFYIDLGYAIPLNERAWEVTDGSILSSVSIQALDITQPGGFMIGLGYLFGMGR